MFILSSLSLVNNSAPLSRTNRSSARVVGNAGRKGLISAGVILLDGKGVILKSGDTLSRLASKISSSIRNFNVKVKEDKGKSRIVINVNST